MSHVRYSDSEDVETRTSTNLAERTFPKKTSSTSSDLIWGTRSTAAMSKFQYMIYSLGRKTPLAYPVHLIAWEPSCVALRLERELQEHNA